LNENIGAQFEEDLSEEFGMERMPGSGNQPWWKLDLAGKGFRFSLKATAAQTATIKASDIDEALTEARKNGEVPAWAYRIDGRDMVMLEKSDFVALCKGELPLYLPSKYSKGAEERVARSKIPAFMRDGN
jgi:uncharacterized membrane protein